MFYKPLTRENIRGIVDLLTADLQKRMAQKQLTVTLTDAAKDLVIERGYDPLYGARPLKRYLQSSAETLIARRILSGDLPSGSTLVLDVKDGELVCDVK